MRASQLLKVLVATETTFSMIITLCYILARTWMGWCFRGLLLETNFTWLEVKMIGTISINWVIYLPRKNDDPSKITNSCTIYSLSNINSKTINQVRVCRTIKIGSSAAAAAIHISTTWQANRTSNCLLLHLLISSRWCSSSISSQCRLLSSLKEWWGLTKEEAVAVSMIWWVGLSKTIQRYNKKMLCETVLF